MREGERERGERERGRGREWEREGERGVYLSHVSLCSGITSVKIIS